MKRGMIMWQVLEHVKNQLLKDRRTLQAPGRDRMESLTRILTITCRSRATRQAFVIMTDQMSEKSFAFVSPHMLAPGEVLTMEVLLTATSPRLHLEGLVARCTARKSQERITYEGLLEIQSINDADCRILQKYIERFRREELNCA
jgi:hypothetical protein